MKHYRFVDYATQGYLAAVGLLMLLFHNERTPLWPHLFAGHVVGMGLVHALIRVHAARRENRVLDFLRHFYPVLLYTGFYRETGELHHLVVPQLLDGHLIRLEHALFGFQPSLELMVRFPYPALSELLYSAYFTYYLMIPGIGLALFVRDRRHFAHYLAVVSFVFYVCYFTYCLVPVMGPRAFHRPEVIRLVPAEVMPATLPDIPPAIARGPMATVMAFIYRTFEAPGAAFPSSHVAIALCTVWFSRRYLPRIWKLHFADVLLLGLSTVYCRYHYVVDVVAGVATVALLVPLGDWLYRRFPGDAPAPPGAASSSGRS